MIQEGDSPFFINFRMEILVHQIEKGYHQNLQYPNKMKP